MGDAAVGVRNVEERIYIQIKSDLLKGGGILDCCHLSLSLYLSQSPPLIDLLWFAGLPPGSFARCSMYAPPPP